MTRRVVTLALLLTACGSSPSPPADAAPDTPPTPPSECAYQHNGTWDVDYLTPENPDCPNNLRTFPTFELTDHWLPGCHYAETIDAEGGTLTVDLSPDGDGFAGTFTAETLTCVDVIEVALH